MKIRTKLILLAVGAMFLPVFLVGGSLFLMSNVKGTGFHPEDPNEYYKILHGHCSSISDFLGASRTMGQAAIEIGMDGEILSSSGSRDDLASILSSIGRSEDSRTTAKNHPRLSLWTQSFDVGGYGTVRVVAENHLSPKRFFLIDPLFVMSFGLLLFIAGFGLRIAQSLQRSLDKLGETAARLAEGNLDTPIDPGRGEDIAQLAHALEKLRLNLRSERAKRARLIMGVSHDFRTPISLIKGYADALKDRVAKDFATEDRYLGVIKDKTGQLEGLVDDLLNYVRMEGDQYRGELPQVDICTFFKTLAAEFAEDAAILERQFAFRPPLHEGILVSVDTKAAGRAFRNLFVNAVHYTQKGGAISLEVNVREHALIVSIVDDGIGIAPEDRESIFEPFYRGKNTAKHGGSGLGLAVVKSVMESHGWEITCASTPGMGTNFTVTIPMACAGRVDMSSSKRYVTALLHGYLGEQKNSF